MVHTGGSCKESSADADARDLGRPGALPHTALSYELLDHFAHFEVYESVSEHHPKKDGAQPRSERRPTRAESRATRLVQSVPTTVARCCAVWRHSMTPRLGVAAGTCGRAQSESIGGGYNYCSASYRTEPFTADRVGNTYYIRTAAAIPGVEDRGVDTLIRFSHAYSFPMILGRMGVSSTFWPNGERWKHAPHRILSLRASHRHAR